MHIRRRLRLLAHFLNLLDVTKLEIETRRRLAFLGEYLILIDQISLHFVYYFFLQIVLVLLLLLSDGDRDGVCLVFALRISEGAH